jgi:membrane protein DedA with SNARE-associated domain
MLETASIIGVTAGLGYLLPTLIALESMGIPSPGETALVLAAVLASQGRLNIELVIVIAAASAIAGDNLGYFLGRRWGREVLVTRGPFHAKRRKMIEVGDRYFAKYGSRTVFIGRWIALIRFATAWLAGINRMDFKVFFFWNALGGITWATAYGLVGYFGGNALAHVLEQVGIGAAIVLVIGGIGFYIYWSLRRRAKERRELDALDTEPEPELEHEPVQSER